MGRFLRYCLVGGVATALHYLVLVAWVVVWHGPAWQGAGVGAVLGAVVAYLGNARFTFGRPILHLGRLLAFLITAALGAACSMALVALVEAAGGHYLAGQLVATVLSLVLTYGVNRRWTFAA